MARGVGSYKDPKFAALPEDDDVAGFLPVGVVEPVEQHQSFGTACCELQVELVSGHRLTITGSYDPDALAALIRKLTP